MKRKKIKLLRAKPPMICKWGYKIKLEESHAKKGFRFHFHCYDCSRDFFFRAWLDVPDHCPHCWNESFLPYWVALPRKMFADTPVDDRLYSSGIRLGMKADLVDVCRPESFSYKCVCCSEVSTFDSSANLPRTCPTCGKSQKDD